MFARRPSTVIPAQNPDQAVIDNTDWEEIGAAPAQTLQQMQTSMPDTADGEGSSGAVVNTQQSVQASVPNASRSVRATTATTRVDTKQTLSSAEALLSNKDFQDVVAIGRGTLSTSEGIKRAAMLAQSDLGVKSTAESYLSKLLVGGVADPSLAAKANTLKKLEEAAQSTFLLPKGYNNTHARVLNEINTLRTALDGATRGVAVQAAKTQYAQNRLSEDKAVEDRATMQDAEEYRLYKPADLMAAISTSKLNGMPVNYSALTMVLKEKLDANNVATQLRSGSSLTPEQNNQRVSLAASTMTDAELTNVINHVRANGENSRSQIDYKNIIGAGTNAPGVKEQENYAFNHNRMSSFVGNKFGNLQISETILNEELIKRSKTRAETTIGSPAEIHQNKQNLEFHTNVATMRATDVHTRVINSGRSIDHQQLMRNAFENAQLMAELDRTSDSKMRNSILDKINVVDKRNDDLIKSTVAVSENDEVNAELLNYYKNGSLSSTGARAVLASELDINGSFTTPVYGALQITDAAGKIVSETAYSHAHPATELENMLRGKLQGQILDKDYLTQMKRPLLAGGKPADIAIAKKGYLQETTMDQWHNALKTLNSNDIAEGKQRMTRSVGNSLLIENLVAAAGTNSAGADLIKSLTTTAGGHIAIKPDLMVKGVVSLSAIRATLDAAKRTDVWDKLMANLADDNLQGQLVGKFAPQTAGQQAMVAMFSGIGLHIGVKQTDNQGGIRVSGVTAYGVQNQFGKMIVKAVRDNVRSTNNMTGTEYNEANKNYQIKNQIEQLSNPGMGWSRLHALQERMQNGN